MRHKSASSLYGQSIPPTSWVVTPSFVHITNYDPITGNVTFSGLASGIDNCSSCCIYIPRCFEYPGSIETITLVSPTNPGTCSNDNTSILVDLKKADGSTPTQSGNSGGPNYPNPLDASSGFNTTIPFVTSSGGVAVITISNEKGVKVLSDDEEVLGGGSHFFYFSGKDLPSGFLLLYD